MHGADKPTSTRPLASFPLSTAASEALRGLVYNELFLPTNVEEGQDGQSSLRQPKNAGLLVGEHLLKVDTKSRLVIASDFRSWFTEGLYVAISPDRSLWILPATVYESLVKAVSVRSDSLIGQGPSVIQHLTSVSALISQLDKGHRFTIPPLIRERAGISPRQQVRVCGSGNFVEVWTEGAWKEFLARPENQRR